MAVEQIAASYQNDGNFAELDLQDVTLNGPKFRIETFRASQPTGTFGTTAAGSTVDQICGNDHLSPESNRVFRSIDSVDRGTQQIVILEIREAYEETGAFYVRARDVDAESESFGHTVLCGVVPLPRNRYKISYELRVPSSPTPRAIVTPLQGKISDLTGLADIGDAPDRLGVVDETLPGNPLSLEIQWNGPKSEINSGFAQFEKIIQSNPKYKRFKSNLIFYLRMGDFRDKCIHNGTNLTGPVSDLSV